MFSLKKWNAVAMWSWDVECDTCAICRVQVMGKRCSREAGAALRPPRARPRGRGAGNPRGPESPLPGGSAAGRPAPGLCRRPRRGVPAPGAGFRRGERAASRGPEITSGSDGCGQGETTRVSGELGGTDSGRAAGPAPAPRAARGGSRPGPGAAERGAGRGHAPEGCSGRLRPKTSPAACPREPEPAAGRERGGARPPFRLSAPPARAGARLALGGPAAPAGGGGGWRTCTSVLWELNNAKPWT